MRDATGSGVSETLQGVLLDALWRQWAALGSPAEGRAPAGAIVDPEALVLTSLAVVEEERRLWDLLAWWGRNGAPLLSVQRMKNLAPEYPDAARSRLREFAHVAVEEGGDQRWRSVSRGPSRRQARPSKVDAPGPRLGRPPTLMLLLRRGMGVGIKPDLLSVLIGENGRGRDVRSLTRATAYSSRAVRRAAEEMAEGRLLRVVQESPVTYSTEAEAWLALLQLDPPPPDWAPWHELFALCLRLETILLRLETEDARYIVSSRVRDLVEAHGDTLRSLGLDLPDPARYRGEEYLAPFLDFVPKLRAWIQEAV